MATLYYKDISGDQAWDNVLNWFTDSAATTQAANAPWVSGVDSTYLLYDLANAASETGYVEVKSGVTIGGAIGYPGGNADLNVKNLGSILASAYHRSGGYNGYGFYYYGWDGSGYDSDGYNANGFNSSQTNSSGQFSFNGYTVANGWDSYYQYY